MREPKGTEMYPYAASWAITLALVLMATVCLIGSSGCVPSHAITQARRQYSVNEAYVGKSLGEPANGIAADAADAWAVQANALAGDPLPAPVVERMRARGDLPE